MDRAILEIVISRMSSELKGDNVNERLVHGEKSVIRGEKQCGRESCEMDRTREGEKGRRERDTVANIYTVSEGLPGDVRSRHHVAPVRSVLRGSVRIQSRSARHPSSNVHTAPLRVSQTSHAVCRLSSSSRLIVSSLSSIIFVVDIARALSSSSKFSRQTSADTGGLCQNRPDFFRRTTTTCIEVSLIRRNINGATNAKIFPEIPNA